MSMSGQSPASVPSLPLNNRSKTDMGKGPNKQAVVAVHAGRIMQDALLMCLDGCMVDAWMDRSSWLCGGHLIPYLVILFLSPSLLFFLTACMHNVIPYLV